MNVNTIGYNYCHNENFSIYRPNGKNEYTLIIMKSKAFFEIDGKTVYTSPNSIIIYDKTTKQYYGADDNIFINDWIHFDIEKKEENIFDELNIPLNTILKPNDILSLSDIIKTISLEKYSNKPHTDKIISLYMNLLMLKISQNLNINNTGNNNFCQELDRLRTLIYSTPSERYSIKELAAQVNLSESYFQYLYKKQFNISPVSDIINSRIEYAKYLLSSTNYAINAIAYELGYTSDIQFISQFKAVTKQSPGNYRKATVDSLSDKN